MKIGRDDLTADMVREALIYDAETGAFFWKRSSRGAKAGDKAGCVTAKGYHQIHLFGFVYRAHRLAWLMTYGSWPTMEIDHIDGDKLNNRLINLRDVSREINGQNLRGVNTRNKTGTFGAQRSGSTWMARITCGGKRIYLGRFDTPEEAQAAYLAAKRQLHPGCTI